MSHNYGGLGRSNQVIPRKQFLTFSQHADVYDKCHNGHPYSYNNGKNFTERNS